jgi:MFS family permease
MSARRRYERILRTPQVGPLVLAALVARLPIGMFGLAIVLFLRAETGSYATAGIVAAAFALGSGAAAPVQGRLVDRLGHRRVVVPLLALNVTGTAGLCVLGSAGGHVVLLALCGVVAGAGVPPVSSLVRTLWPTLLRETPDLVPTAFALDGVVVECVFVGGPLLVAGVSTAISPVAALALASGMMVAGGAAFLSSAPSRAWRPDEHRVAAGLLGALRSPGLRTLVLTTVPFGFCFGAMEVTLPAFADDAGNRGLAGLLLAAWSLASAAGGLLYGAHQHDWRLSVREVYIRVALVLPFGFLPLLLAPSIPVMALLVIPAGVCIAPLLTAGNQLVETVAPPGMTTEAYTWPITSLVIGIALGSASAGALVQLADWRVAILAAAGVATLGGTAALVRRATLVPAARAS